MLSGGWAARVSAQTAPRDDPGEKLDRSTSDLRTAKDRAAAEWKPLVTAELVRRWVADWQHRLRLDDWKIEARMVRVWELKQDTLGNVKWNRDKKSAVIRVLDPVDYELPADKIAADIENTVVHELLHIRLSALPKDRNNPKVEEGVVNPLAQALLDAVHRESQEKPK